MGVKYQHIGRWERGVKPTAMNLAKLASALKVDVSELTAPPPILDNREIIDVQTTTDIDGRFEFNDIFFHDTDRIQIQASYEGENSMLWDSADFYCYYCSCFGSPLEIVLRETPSP